MSRVSISAVLLSLMAAFVGQAAIPEASAHVVSCSNDAQEPFFNASPAPSRGTLQGATIIECSPTAPDAQRTEVQVQWEQTAGTWTNRGEP